LHIPYFPFIWNKFEKFSQVRKISLSHTSKNVEGKERETFVLIFICTLFSLIIRSIGSGNEGECTVGGGAFSVGGDWRIVLGRTSRLTFVILFFVEERSRLLSAIENEKQLTVN
jgi:hypothetical protein